MAPVTAPDDAIDIVGTGGDGAGTSTSRPRPRFVVAGAGVPSPSTATGRFRRNSGAADVLAALGVKIDLPPDRSPAASSEAGIGFMFAPAHHGA